MQALEVLELECAATPQFSQKKEFVVGMLRSHAVAGSAAAAAAALAAALAVALAAALAAAPAAAASGSPP